MCRRAVLLVAACTVAGCTPGLPMVPPSPPVLTGVMGAVHTIPSGVAVDLVFEGLPDHSAVERAIGGGAPVWRDDSHLHLSWNGSAPPAIDLPESIPTSHGSHLAGPLHLDLRGPVVLRRVTVPPAPPGPVPATVGFSVGTDASRASVAAHVDRLTELSPAGWRVSSNGDLTGAPERSAVTHGAAARVPIWPLVQNDSTDTAGIAALLEDAGAAGRLISTIASAVADAGFPGAQLDIEGVPAADRDRLTAFVGALAAALHSRGRRLAVDVVPHRPDHLNRYSAAYDDPAIARAADAIVLLAYDQHSGGSDPGPIAGLGWQGQILDGSLVGIDRARAALGLPLYARIWEGGHSVPAAYADAVRLALGRDGATVDYDFAEATPWIHWPASDGSPAAAYFDDADSLARKIALARDRGLGGIAVWRLGFEDPAVWDLLGSRASVQVARP